MPPPPGVNLVIHLAPNRRRMARSMRRLLTIIANSDAKLASRDPAVAYLPIFPTDDAPLQAALTLIRDRLDLVIDPDE